jgi:putative redox protein
MNDKQKSPQTYNVTVSRQDESHATAVSREHSLTLNIKRGGGEAGFNAAETLLAALGTCVLTNVNTYIQKMRLNVNNVRIELDGVRQDDPPMLTQIHYRLVFDSPEPLEKLHALHEISLRYGTVMNTLMHGIQPQGEVIVIQRESDPL